MSVPTQHKHKDKYNNLYMHMNNRYFMKYLQIIEKKTKNVFPIFFKQTE